MQYILLDIVSFNSLPTLYMCSVLSFKCVCYYWTNSLTINWYCFLFACVSKSIHDEKH